MGWYEEKLLPHLVDRTCGIGDLQPWRRAAADGLAGTVVEIGFGSGLNLAVYPDEVTRVLAVEPADVAWRLASARVTSAAVPVERVGLDGESLPLADASCDAALCTFTLCTIPDAAAALAEVHRVLRPGGRLHFLEHAGAPDPAVARWQRRLDPLQQRLAGGCHLTRDPVELLTEAGFEVRDVESGWARSRSPWTWLVRGVATTPA